MAIENYVRMLCDIFRTQVHRDARAAKIKGGSHPTDYKEFYYNGKVPLDLEVFNNNYILPYAYATSVLKRHYNVENRQGAFPLYSGGKSEYSDLEHPTDYDIQTKATADAHIEDLHMMALLLKRNWWPEGVCQKRGNVRCPKPSKGAQPDILVEIPANAYFAFPVPVLHVEIVGKKTVFGEVEFKGWVVALNALAMMPTSFYLEVYHDHWALYKFSRNELVGKIEVEKTRYEMICDSMEKFRSTLSDLSYAILRAMFEIISYLNTVRHAQYDLDDIGKQYGKSKSGSQIKVCDECFDFDEKTIDKMMTTHWDKFLDGPRDDKENLRTPEASDEETEPFYADEDFKASNLCNPLTSVNSRRRLKDTEETAFMSPSKSGPGGDGLPEPQKSHGKSSGKGHTSKGRDRSGKDGTGKGDDSNTRARKGDDSNTEDRKGDDSNGEDEDENIKPAGAARNLFPDPEVPRRKREESSSTDSSTSSVKQRLLTGQRNKKRRTEETKNVKEKAMMKMMMMKKQVQQASKTMEQEDVEESDVPSARKEETQNVKQAAQHIERDEDEDAVNTLPLYTPPPTGKPTNQPAPGMLPNQPPPGLPPYPLQIGGPAIRLTPPIPPIQQPASGILPNPPPAAAGMSPNPAASGMPPTKQDPPSTVTIAAKAKPPSPNRKVSPTKRDSRDKRPEWDECKNQ